MQVDIRGLRDWYFTGDTVEGTLQVRWPRERRQRHRLDTDDNPYLSSLIITFRVREQTRLRGEHKIYEYKKTRKEKGNQREKQTKTNLICFHNSTNQQN